jgi:hypothetical protein
MSGPIPLRYLGSLCASAALILSLLGWPPPSRADDLPGAPRQGWVHWQVEQEPNTGEACCYEKGGRRGCQLDSKGAGRGFNLQMSRAAEPASAAAGQHTGLQIWAFFEAGKATRIRALSASCPVHADGPVQALTGIDQDTSIAWLAEQVADHAVGENALPALALHAGEAATAALSRFTESGADPELRRDAAFWLGQARGQAGLPRLLELARGNESGDFMRHLAFVLSQSELAPAAAELRRLARQHADPGVRGQALFWMAESSAEGAREEILKVLGQTRDTELLHQAVFALSRLEDGDAALIALIEADYPREAKRQALFWLGQSGSAQALSFLDRYLGAQR